MTFLHDVTASLARHLSGLSPAPDVALKGLLVLLAAFALNGLLGRAPAALRHRIWLLASLALYLLPVVTMTVPSWRVQIVPPPTGGEAAWSESPAVASTATQAGAVADVATNGSQRSAEDLSRSGFLTGRVSLWVPWAVGSAFMLTRLLAGIVISWRRVRHAHELVSGPFFEQGNHLAGRLGIRRRVSFRLTTAGSMPLTLGVLRPIVLLPSNVEQWPVERLRAVLLHELAHVARFDVLAQLLAQLAVAIHWFNPLTYLAERQLRREGESASDDVVLTSGFNPHDYAAQLVEVVRQMRISVSLPAGVAMARTSGLERRLAAILDPSCNRRRLSKKTSIITSAATACLAIGIGIVHVEAQEHESRSDQIAAVSKPNASYELMLDDGRKVTIEIVGVSTYPPGPKTWWNANGDLLDQAPCDPVDAAQTVKFLHRQSIGTLASTVPLLEWWLNKQSDGRFSDYKELRLIAVRVSGLPENAELIWHPRQCISEGLNVAKKDGQPVPNLRLALAVFHQKESTISVWFQVGDEWTTLQAYDVAGHLTGPAHDDSAIFGKLRAIPGGAIVTAAFKESDHHSRIDHVIELVDRFPVSGVRRRSLLKTRLVAIDGIGETHPPPRSSENWSGDLYLLNATFDLPPEQITGFQIQTPRFKSLEIHGVAFNPK